MKTSELREIISKIVGEELRKQLPAMLSEMYIKKIVAEQAQHQPRGGDRPQAPRSATLGEVLMGDEDLEDQRIPTPPQNGHRGIYNNESKEALRERIKRSVLESDENPYASVYEGIDLSRDPGPGGTDGIPLDAIPGIGRAAQLAGIQQQTRGPIPETPEMKMRKLEENRKRLDSIKVG